MIKRRLLLYGWACGNLKHRPDFTNSREACQLMVKYFPAWLKTKRHDGLIMGRREEQR